MGHFCGKWLIKMRDPMSLRHPVCIKSLMRTTRILEKPHIYTSGIVGLFEFRFLGSLYRYSKTELYVIQKTFYYYSGMAGLVGFRQLGLSFLLAHLAGASAGAVLDAPAITDATLPLLVYSHGYVCLFTWVCMCTYFKFIHTSRERERERERKSER